MLGLSCGTWDLHCFRAASLKSGHVGYLFLVCGLFSCSLWDLLALCVGSCGGMQDLWLWHGGSFSCSVWDLCSCM